MMRDRTTIRLSREDMIAAVGRFLKEERFQGAELAVESIAADSGGDVATPASFLITVTFPPTDDDLD